MIVFLDRLRHGARVTCLVLIKSINNFFAKLCDLQTIARVKNIMIGYFGISMVRCGLIFIMIAKLVLP